MATNWKVRTQANAYVDGYQSAMQDMADAFERGGPEAAQQWLKDNHTRKSS